MDTELKKFTLYWTDGKREVICGKTISDAFRAAGYGQSALNVLDWYDAGDTDTHSWDSQLSIWVSRLD